MRFNPPHPAKVRADLHQETGIGHPAPRREFGHLEREILVVRGLQIVRKSAC